MDVQAPGKHQSDARTLLLSAALAGHGLFPGPELVVAKAVAEGKLNAVLDDYERAPTRLYAVYPQSKHVSTEFRSFVDFTAEVWGSPQSAM